MRREIGNSEILKEERKWLNKKCLNEAEVEARNWEKRNADVALYEVNQEFESQRFQLQQASRWAEQAQRDNISLNGKMELRTRPLQENHARDCQEIEEL